ncbi:MAG: methionine biosynthesis protein MetW [Pseudomonadota bacterium]
MISNAGAPRYRRADHQAIAQFIGEGEKVLDVGCGDGQLMELLQAELKVRARGLEISQSGVNRCLAKGLSVVQGDADEDLPVYPDNAFDVAILSKTVQEMSRPAAVLRELSRIAPKIVVSFRNYGHWRVRWSLLTTGRMPTLGSSGPWYSEGARRICTAQDFADLAETLDLTIVKAAAISGARADESSLSKLNWLSEEVVFVLERR